jgi:hypothetical protein
MGEPKKKNKKKLSDKELLLEQAAGVRLTDRQFKAMVICNMAVGVLSSRKDMVKADVSALLPDFKDLSEEILEMCILDPMQ